MGRINFWSMMMMMMIICWVKHKYRKRKKGVLLNGSKEVGLDVNKEKTIC
jgi:hypothetical protein